MVEDEGGYGYVSLARSSPAVVSEERWVGTDVEPLGCMVKVDNGIQDSSWKLREFYTCITCFLSRHE